MGRSETLRDSGIQGAGPLGSGISFSMLSAGVEAEVDDAISASMSRSSTVLLFHFEESFLSLKI